MPKINTLNLNSIDYEIEDATARASISKLGKLPFIEITEVAGRNITAQVTKDTQSDTGKLTNGSLVGYSLFGEAGTIGLGRYFVDGLASQGVDYLVNAATGHDEITGAHKGVAVYRNDNSLEIIC